MTGQTRLTEFRHGDPDPEGKVAEAHARLDAALFRLSAAEMGLANARHDAARRDAAAALSGLSGLFGALGGMIMAAIKLAILVLLYRSFFGF